ARCGPACRVVWQGPVSYTDCPYADAANLVYPSNLKMQASAGDKSALGKAVVGKFGDSKPTTANAA
ncbi:MAG: hypothetical protein ACK4S8_14055, partial [Alishewanella aestuarii]